jgi:hypothetical protein
MASTVELYIGPIKIGSGSAAADSASITGYSNTSGIGDFWKASVSSQSSGAGFDRHPDVTVLVTQAGTHVGRSWYTRITGDNGAGTLTLRDKCPFVGA